ncbi:MAG: TonB-dependent receptor [Calditrichaeota bacterium]|nr:MAG: TonB-dependent receptor [Calditrichota bacterium]
MYPSHRAFSFPCVKAVLLFCCLVLIPGIALAQTGAITGVVTAKGSGDPLVGANVVIVGTNLGTATGVNGEYEISGVPPGTHTVSVLYLGYREARQTVTVEAGATATANFELEETGILGEAVVVSASRKPEKLTEAPATVDVINAGMIEEHASFNVGELFSRQKGVDYVRAGVFGTGLNIRGFNSAFNAKNLQMNDSRISTLIATGLPLGPLATTVKEDIDRIEVILGPSGALYGPNAHNGLVNIITKDPRVWPGTTVVLGGGNQSVLSGRLRHAQVVNPKLAYKVTAEYTRGEDFEYVDSVYIGGVAFEELDLDRDFNSLRGEAALYFTPKPGHDIIIAGGASNSNYLSQTNAGRNQIKDWRVFFLQGRFTSPHLFAQVYHTWSKTDSTYAINQRTQNYWSFKNAGFSDAEARQRSYREFWFPLSDTTGIPLNRTAIFIDDSRRWNAELQYNNTLAGFNFILGGQWQRDMADSKGTYLLDQDGPITLDQFGLYGQVEKPLGNSFKAVLAARVDDHELYGTNFIPKAALVYSTPNGTWRLTYGKGIAAPTILNLSANIFGGILLGNGEGFTVRDSTGNVSKIDPLEVETIQTIELGYKGIVNRKLYIDANAYYNISENFLSPLINIAPPGGTVTHRGDQPLSEIIPGTPSTGSPFVLTYLNFGKVNTFGADVGLNFYFNDHWNLTVNYSYFDFDMDENDPRNDGNRDGVVDVKDLPINTPTHKATVGLNYRQEKFFGSVFARWVDEYDFFSGINVAAKTNENLIYNGDPVIEGRRVGRDFNEGPLGGFVNVDVTAGYRLSKHLTISAQVTNLFDAEVREFVASPPVGRLISTELKLSL